jgi:hypothetical protein
VKIPRGLPRGGFNPRPLSEMAGFFFKVDEFIKLTYNIQLSRSSGTDSIFLCEYRYKSVSFNLTIHVEVNIAPNQPDGEAFAQIW